MSGTRLEHVVDYGPLYHLIEPQPTSTWRLSGGGVKIAVTNSKGIHIVIITRLIMNIKLQESRQSLLLSSLTLD